MQPNMAAQRVLPKEQAGIGITLLAFVQFLGGTIFVAVCQNLLANKLIDGLTGQMPNFDPGSIANQEATSLREQVPADKLAMVLEVYNDALQAIWYVGLALACLILVGSLGMEWKSIKKQQSEDAEST